jgi:small-conductance mechanosensitive channel
MKNIEWQGWDTLIAGNSLLEWGYAFAIFLLGWMILSFLKSFLLNRFLRRSSSHPAWIYVATFIQVTRQWSLALLSGIIVLDVYTESEKLDFYLKKAIILVLLFQTTIWGLALLQTWLDSYAKKRAQADPGIASTLGLIRFALKTVFLVFIVLMGLSNLGVNITAMVAGLGVGGIAVALAAQNILGDLFASLTIVLDKPFVVGDYIVLKDLAGTVEYIGLKTTRIRNLSGDQIIIKNSDLLSTPIRNIKRMVERRVVQSIGVVYQTKTEQLKLIPKLLKESVEETPRTRFDRAHLKQFGAYSVDFELVYWILDSDYLVYMDAQEMIHLKIWEKFERNNIVFAYPTQQIFLNSQNS